MTTDIQAQRLIGRCIRTLREERKLTLDQLATEAGITYQYLSGVENGKENFSISVLEAIAAALRFPLKSIVALAFENSETIAAPKVDPNFFRGAVPLPAGLTVEHLDAAMNQAQSIIHRINQNLRLEVGKALHEFIQGNNFSGLISNIFSDAINDNSPYKHNHDQRYPDLINKSAHRGKGEGLEVKATINVGKGGESHNGHSGWHTVACYELDKQGDIRFIHIMFAMLNGHQHSSPDWKYLGSKVNEDTGSRRTETYITTLEGTTKLRDGSIYLDPSKVDHSRWRQRRHNSEAAPSWSIFSAPPPPEKPQLTRRSSRRRR
jgi:transcriptional regulator with XRE-family HTH domain